MGRVEAFRLWLLVVSSRLDHSQFSPSLVFSHSFHFSFLYISLHNRPNYSVYTTLYHSTELCFEMSGRAQKLRSALERTISSGVSSCSFDVFLGFFPFATSEADKSLLFDAYSELMQVLRSHIDAEFDAICAEFDLDAKLARLDALFSSRSNHAEREEYAGMDAVQYARHLEADALAEQIRAMESEAERLVDENARLEADVAAVVRELSAARRGVEKTALVFGDASNRATDASDVVESWASALASSGSSL